MALSLNQTSLSLYAGDSYKLLLTGFTSGATITWSSSNTSVATVTNSISQSEGDLVCNIAGTCIITATSSKDGSITCSITVSGISISYIASKIGIGTNDIGRLIAQASVGGIATSLGYNAAFQIVENGYGINAGGLINGALPKWNIYSTNAPGQWILPTYGTQSVLYWLKRGYDLSRYMFSLGSFAGYNHSANGLSMSSSNYLSVVSSGTIPFYPDIVVNLGSYNWASLPGVTQFKVSCFQGTTKIADTSLNPIVLDTPVEFNGVNSNDFNISVNLATALNTTYTLYVVLCNASGTELARLPISTAFSVITYVAVANSMILHNDGSTPLGLISPNAPTYSTNKMSVSYLENGGSYPSPTLIMSSITYTLMSAITGNLINSLVVTLFGSYDSPQSIPASPGLINGTRYNISVEYDSNRLKPADSSQYLIVTIDFEDA